MKKIKSGLYSIGPMILGGLLAYKGAGISEKYLGRMLNLSDYLLGGLICLIAIYFQIIIHELGHLVCGLLTGYEFVSFRIGSLMLVKTNGSYEFKRFNIPGTGGQCLLNLKEDTDFYEYNYILYNLGGGLFNLFSIIPMLIIIWLTNNWLLKLFSFFMIVFGLISALMNLIPIKINGMSNDGHNIKDLRSDPESRKSLYLQLRINKHMVDGIRLKDMDDQLFIERQDLDPNPLNTSLDIIRYERLIDMGRLEEGREALKELLESGELVDIHQSTIRSDEVFWKILDGVSKSEIDDLIDENLKNYLKLTKNYPSTIRTYYGYYSKLEGDIEKAKDQLKKYNKIKKSYPYIGEIEKEDELMKLVDS